MVAIVGRPNVGKSTLFNRLLRQRRALVEDWPGVTRDRVVASARIEGRDLLLVDTGGLDPEADRGIPAAVAAQVRRAVRDAAVILFVVDARAGVLPADREIAGLLRRAGRQVVVVANKADHPRLEPSAAEFHGLGFETLVCVSAEHKRGLADLELEIAARLAPPRPARRPAGDAVALAVVGRPNVGKSSLVNRLAGESHALVSEEPGTTRDATDLRLRFDRREIVLTDTAGLRRAGRRDNHIERGSALMALRAIERAEVAILLLDASEGVTEQDARIAQLALSRGRPLVVGLNKWDTVGDRDRQREIERELERRLRFLPGARIERVSALTGRGVRRLVRAALELRDQSLVSVRTADVNRVLQEALAAHQPPAPPGRRPLRLFYATQVSQRPFTVAIFTSDPKLVPATYRRYLQSFFRKRLGLGSGPVRVLLRARARRAGDTDAAG
jgi:GTP-binding protein